MEELTDVPENLLSIPGILQDVVNFYNDTAIKPQPQFAVVTAIILGATVMGRRFVTDTQNFPSLYAVVVSKSSTGKEHCKTSLETPLLAAALDKLVGSGGYTSSGGVISALLKSPSHVAIIDELGRVMKSTKMDGNSNKMDVHTTFMELFGRLNGVFRPPQYSTLALSESARKEMAPRDISHPALSLLAMTTPSTLYQSLNSSFIKDGFLPRFIIVESQIQTRQLTRMVKQVEPPKRLLDWMKTCASTYAPIGNQSHSDTAQNPPDPKVIPFDPDCIPLLDAYEVQLNDLMDDYEDFGLSEMFGKSREIAQRISLIVAVSCKSETILPEHVNWAVDFVSYYNLRVVKRLITCVSDSEFEAECKEIYDVIFKGGPNGATGYEIRRSSKRARSLDKNKMGNVMTMVMFDYGVELVEIPREGAGAPRRAYVARHFIHTNPKEK